MANKFWVGGGSTTNWNATSNTNWANSSGGPGNQTAPGVGDVAVFDSNSGTANSVLNTAFTIQGLECDGSTAGTGTYGGTLTHNTSTTLTINTGAANSFRLTSGMTYSAASNSALVTFTNTSGTAQLKSAGKRLGALTINGSGGTVQLQDDLRVDATVNDQITLTVGTLDANGFAITTPLFSIASNAARTLILGGTVKIGGINANPAQTIWSLGASGTFTKNSANIEIVPSNTNTAWTFSGGGVAYNDLILDATTTRIFLSLNVSAGVSFSHLTVGAGWSVMLPASVTVTLGNPLVVTGTQSQPSLLYSSNSTSANAVLSCTSGACTLSWGGLAAITGQGGATWTATNTMDFGLNIGWTISPPSDSTLVLTAPEITTLGKMIDGVACGTVTTGASTTSVPTSALSFNGVAATGVVSNEFAGRVIQFSGTTTTAGLRGTTSAISANTASNTPTFTVATLPATPAAGDIFCVI